MKPQASSLRAIATPRSVELAVSGLLASTAALKSAGLGAGALASDGWYARPDVQAAAVAWEFLLATGLVWGGARRLVWLLTVITFALFAGINLSMALAGQATCNCFGVVAVNPWWVLTLDATVLVALAAARPPLAGYRRPWAVLAEARPVLGYAVAAGMLAGLGLAAGTVVFGSPSAALARLRGQVGSVGSGLVQLGEQDGGSVLSLAVEVVNHQGVSLTVAGGTANCSCVTWQAEPVTIPPYDRGAIMIAVRLPQTAGRFQQQASLYADSGGRLHELPFTIVASVVSN